MTSFVILTLLVNVGCATVHRPTLTLETLESDAVTARAQHHKTVDDMIEALARRAVQRGDANLDILMLSAGGENGAYGVGFLRGWQERRENPMPPFDLVTGVSTGALQAAFALIGNSQALNEATELYRKAGTEFAPSLDWFFWLRPTGGFVKTSRLHRAIQENFNDDLAKKLSEEFSKNRQLAISTADMDLGIGRVWNFSRELQPDSSSLMRMHQVLFAASAIPGVFPIERIDNHLHGDGGVVASLLPIFTLADYQRLAARLKELGVSEVVKIHVWVIHNTFTHPPLAVIAQADRSALSDRGVELLYSLAQPLMDEYMTTLATAVSTGVPGLRMDISSTSLPPALATDPGATSIFDEHWIDKLLTAGYEQAKSAKPWQTWRPSAYVRPSLTELKTSNQDSTRR